MAGAGILEVRQAPGAAHHHDLQVPIYNIWKKQEKAPSVERFDNNPSWKARIKA
jgi:hypothetical protein